MTLVTSTGEVLATLWLDRSATVRVRFAAACDERGRAALLYGSDHTPPSASNHSID